MANDATVTAVAARTMTASRPTTTVLGAMPARTSRRSAPREFRTTKDPASAARAAIPLAAGVFYHSYGVALSPAVAALAMAASSVSVMLSSLWLTSFKRQAR